MNICFVGRYLEDIIPYFQKHHFVCCSDNPDMVVTHGGDGTLLGAERQYPGVPKFPIRDQRSAKLCDEHHYENQIKLFLEDQLQKTTLMKLKTDFKGQELIGMNDIFLHNADRGSAIRYRVLIDDELYADDVVADGVGVSTVHGSTAYYRSITHSTFRVGIGLAFSNTTEVTNHIVLPEDSEIKIQVTRGPGILMADNNPDRISINEGDEFVIKKTDETAVICGLEQFMCPACRTLRYSRRHQFEQQSIYKEPLI